jgi:uncharacterized protein YciI
MASNVSYFIQFIILAALFAVAAADSYRSAEYAPKYEAPAYKSTYEAKYEVSHIS